MRLRFAVSFAVLALVGLVFAAAPPPPPVAEDGLPPAAHHLALGNPSKAKTNPKAPDNYLLREPYFALSYNNAKGTPNWVSWHLSAEYLGSAPRRKRFTPDPLLPAGFTRIAHNDYTNSGFQRGHMCPHGDRAADKEMSFATFVMTNIVPQSSECNEGSWESLESYGRFLVEKKEKDLFIVAGPIGKGGTGEKGAADALADGKVTVPAKVFKVILVVDDPDDGSDPTDWVGDDARLIAVIMPNDRSVAFNDWAKYRVSVKEVEDATGFRFFDKVHGRIKAKKELVDMEAVPKMAKKHHGFGG